MHLGMMCSWEAAGFGRRISYIKGLDTLDPFVTHLKQPGLARPVDICTINRMRAVSQLVGIEK